MGLPPRRLHILLPEKDPDQLRMVGRTVPVPPVLFPRSFPFGDAIPEPVLRLLAPRGPQTDPVGMGLETPIPLEAGRLGEPGPDQGHRLVVALPPVVLAGHELAETPLGPPGGGPDAARP